MRTSFLSKSLVAIGGMLVGHIIAQALLGHTDDTLGAWSIEVGVMVLSLAGFVILSRRRYA